MGMIEINNVSKIIKKTVVLDQITMNIERGECVGLAGVNGSGKTMLMRLICGLVFPTKGSITINGKTLGKDISFPESVGVLIENPAFLDGYDAFANLKLLASIKAISTDDDIKDMLKIVGLDPNSKKKYRKFSLGMKQRLGIAAACLEKPELLILDEPTNALDTKGVDMLYDLIETEKNRGTTIILSSHDDRFLKELSEKIYYMENGRVVEG